MHHDHTIERGFIALMAILLLSVTLFGMTLSLAQFGIVTRFNMLNIEQKQTSALLAESCVQYAEIFVAHDPEYLLTQPQEFSVGDHTCTLIAVTKHGSEHTIEAQGISGPGITNLEVIVDSQNGHLISWEEVGS